MSALDKLLKYMNSKNVAEFLDDKQLQDIADDVILGYQIDDDSRQQWLETNQNAVKLIKHCEDGETRNFPFEDSAKVIYPLLAPAIIQLASRMTTHITRNNKVAECAVLGKDSPAMDQQTGQPIPGHFVKQDKAKRVGDYLSYELLIESKTWLKDDHKLCSIVAGWGIGFKQVYYDYIFKRPCSEVLSPEDVIINHNSASLEKAQRITIKHYLTKNEMVQNIRAGYFLDIDLDELDHQSIDAENTPADNDSREKQPNHEFLCQTCYIDLDDDDYLEPYKCYVHLKSRKVMCIVPAFDYKDIDFTEAGKILSIVRRLDVVDRHLIDDPEGKYYSVGLNYLLFHTNTAITSILRQLIDAGTLSNAASVSGFVTKAFKTKERAIRVKLGEFTVLDCNPNIDPSKQIIPLPFREPSQVLLGLLQLLIQSGKENGFITDILTGDVEMQNVPATTALAAIEQGTRAFKPIIEKLYVSLKNEFEVRFYLNSKYLDQEKYIRFNGDQFAISKDDFDMDSMDVRPVADPTQSSEAHKYAKCRGLIEAMQVFGQVTNQQVAALRYFSDLGYEAPEELIAQPQPQQPDSKVMKVQLDEKLGVMKNKIAEMQVQLIAAKLENERNKLGLKAKEVSIKEQESDEKQMKMRADAMKDQAEASIKQQMANVADKKVQVDMAKVHAMKNKRAE